MTKAFGLLPTNGSGYPVPVPDKVGLAVGALAIPNMTYRRLWLYYIGLGGRSTRECFNYHLATEDCPADEHNLIAQALNECHLDSGSTGFPVAYR